jgi:hypothetical protein
VRSRSLAALALVVAFALGACAGPAATAAADTGIKGTVTLGPTCPVEQPGQAPCITPYVATLVIANAQNGKEVARVTSAADGSFRVAVPPGDYVIAPQPGADNYPTGQPVSVHVAAGSFTDVAVLYDTGIR